LKSLSQELDKDIKTLEATIFEIAGEIQFSFKTLEISYLKNQTKENENEDLNMQRI
jgi:hypothetical protein